MEPRLDAPPIEAHVLRRNWYFPIASVVLVAIGVLVTPKLGYPAALVGWLGAWLGVWFAPLSLLRNAFPLARRTTLQVSEQALTIEGRAPIPVADIAEARIVPRAVRRGEVVVELGVRARAAGAGARAQEKITLSLEPGMAQHVLSVLGAGAGMRRATFRIVVPFGVRFVWTILVLGAVWVGLAFFLGGNVTKTLAETLVSFLFLSITVAAAANVVRGKVVIGAEGFTMRWFLRDRFVRFADIDTVARAPGVLADTVLDLRAATGSKKRKRSIRLRTVDQPDTSVQRGAEARALLDHMVAAFERWHRTPTAAELGAHLQRGRRTAKEWLSGIDQLVRGGEGAGYRVAAPTPEVLVALARGSKGDAPEARIGAAAALLRIDESAHRATVRIAADACAEPMTRAALLELAEAEDDAALTAALDRVAPRTWRGGN